MSEIIDFLAMGGYARFIWPAYILAAIVLLLNVMLPVRKEKNLIDRLRTYHSRNKL
ncbi:MAG: heme exporter protein CcmD [Gammaproteobacteria bacterium]